MTFDDEDEDGKSGIEATNGTEEVAENEEDNSAEINNEDQENDDEENGDEPEEIVSGTDDIFRSENDDISLYNSDQW